MRDFRSQKGFIHYFLLFIILIVVLIAGYLYIKSNLPKKSLPAGKQSSITTPKSETDTKKITPTTAAQKAPTNLNEAFAEEKNYSNPFESNKNPFDYLNE